MAILYKTGRYATKNTEDSLTEQEHKDSCDINLMLKSAARGQAIRTNGRSGIFWKGGDHDDLSQTQLSMRIQKQETEEYFAKLPKDHFSEEQLKHLPLALIQKFGFKPKDKNAKKSKNAIKDPKTAEPPTEPTAPATPPSETPPKAD